MNSFLQALFHTPLLRKMIFEWAYDPILHEEEKDCIPFQLQKLFAMLQMKLDSFVDTKDLTKSFQWFGNEGFEQHDLQVSPISDSMRRRRRSGPDGLGFVSTGVLEDSIRCDRANDGRLRSEGNH